METHKNKVYTADELQKACDILHKHLEEWYMKEKALDTKYKYFNPEHTTWVFYDFTY